VVEQRLHTHDVSRFCLEHGFEHWAVYQLAHAVTFMGQVRNPTCSQIEARAELFELRGSHGKPGRAAAARGSSWRSMAQRRGRRETYSHMCERSPTSAKPSYFLVLFEKREKPQ
jgi:hypothetical protein